MLADLETNGLKVTTHDKSLNVHFILALILGDNPGLNEFLDFNSSFSSNYFCRFCTESKEVTKFQCIENDNQLRNIQNYEKDALALTPLQTGIKKNSIFNTIPSFHVTKNYAADLMHDWFEGICSYVLCHTIKHYIGKNIFSLDILNSRKQCFNYGPIEISHISKPIKPKHLENNRLKMSARQMITFVHFFTLIIGDLINDENDEVWLLYLNFISINDILLSYAIPLTTISILKQKIFELNSEYIRLFNDSLKPKFHMLIHYPKIIEMSGPPRHYWSMGFEEKHRDFKIYSHIMNSRKNICLTIARKYQFKFASFLNDDKSSELMFNDKHKVLSEFTDFVNQKFKIPLNCVEYYSKISYRGCIYKTDYYLSQFQEKMYIYKIKLILIIRNTNNFTIHILCETLNSVKYEKHYASYSVDPLNLLDELSIKNIDEFDGPPLNLNITHSGIYMLRLKDYYK